MVETMLTDLPGFILSRTIPENCLLGVATGAYRVCGGVIRNGSGQIVAHLINSSPNLLSANPLSAVAEVVNTVQLYKMGRSLASLEAATAQLVSLAQGTALLSGLTLAVSVGGFAFLSSRLNRLDKRLGELAKDVKAIQALLASQERAALNNALQTLSTLPSARDDKVRIPLLVNARQTIGTIYQRYREQLEAVTAVEEVLAIEEYFSVTALSHALCTAELGMQAAAAAELEKAYELWLAQTRRISKATMLANPERFLGGAYQEVKTEELVDWLDFAHETEHGIAWIDTLRDQSASFRLPRFGSGASDKLGIDLIRKFSARNRVFQGYTAQYQYFSEHDMLPSQHQQFIARLRGDKEIGDCHVFIAAPGRG
jgi:tetratricopeptide (TPR) repeat protein